MKLRWTRVALQDLRHLYEYISEDNPLAGSQMVNRIQDAAQRLKKHPQMGRPGRVQGTGGKASSRRTSRVLLRKALPRNREMLRPARR